MSFSLDLRYEICLQPIELPVFNPVALELLQLLSDPETEIDTFIRIIHKDQALSMQILRMANSSAYAGRTEINTIKDAVSRLGTEQITNLAMAASQSAIHASKLPLVNSLMRDLWVHSYSCAIGCRSLALSTGNKKLADCAYLAGLLHDVGKLYLLKAMERINLNCETRFPLVRATLLDVFSDMHVEQGFRIMGHWDIPAMYHSIVANHHVEQFNSNDILLAIVRLVNYNSQHYKNQTHCSLNCYPHRKQPQDVAHEAGIMQASEVSLSLLEKDMSSIQDDRVVI